MTGLRVSEALGLLWGDLGFPAQMLSVSGQLGVDGIRRRTKTPASAATLPLLPVLKRSLLKHRLRQASRDIGAVRADRIVFVTARGEPQDRRNALRAIHTAGNNAGLNEAGRQAIGLHDVRHSFIAIALEHGVTLPEAAQLARHANARVTAGIYAGVADGARERIAAKLLSSGFGI
jgi:integrase